MRAPTSVTEFASDEKTADFHGIGGFCGARSGLSVALSLFEGPSRRSPRVVRMFAPRFLTSADRSASL